MECKTVHCRAEVREYGKGEASFAITTPSHIAPRPSICIGVQRYARLSSAVQKSANMVRAKHLSPLHTDGLLQTLADSCCAISVPRSGNALRSIGSLGQVLQRHNYYGGLRLLAAPDTTHLPTRYAVPFRTEAARPLQLLGIPSCAALVYDPGEAEKCAAVSALSDAARRNRANDDSPLRTTWIAGAGGSLGVLR